MSNDTERKPIPLPPFLYESDGVIRVGYDGDTDVTDEYNEWISKLRVVEEVDVNKDETDGSEWCAKCDVAANYNYCPECGGRIKRA